MARNIRYAKVLPYLAKAMQQEPELYAPFLSRIKPLLKQEPEASPTGWTNFWRDTVAVGTLLSGVSGTFAAIYSFQNRAIEDELRKENSEQKQEIMGMKKEIDQIARFRSEAAKELERHGVLIPGTEYKVGFFKETKDSTAPKEKIDFPEEKPKGPKV